MINKAALTIFHSIDENIKDKDYLFLIRDIGLQEAIEIALKDKMDKEYLLEMDNFTYKVNMKYIEASWITGGVILMLENITQRVELERNKREFFANASHELKSPLTCIIGYQQLITEGIETDLPSIIDCSKKTLKEANRMNSIVVDMLNLSKLERKESIQIEKLDADIIIDDILDTFKSKIQQKDLIIEKELKPVTLSADKNHLDQLFRNLIDLSLIHI